MRVLGVSRMANITAVPPKARATGSPKNMAPKQHRNIKMVRSSTLNLAHPK